MKASDHGGITDIVTFMGHYTSIATTLAFYDVPAGAIGTLRRHSTVHICKRPDTGGEFAALPAMAYGSSTT